MRFFIPSLRLTIPFLNGMFICILIACQQVPSPITTPKPSGWKVVYQHDKNGKHLLGNIDSLIAGVRKGYDVRIGWGWQREVADSILTLEHMAEPLFLSIIQEEHISAIIDAHPMLESYVLIDQQSFKEGGHIWQCVLTTRGTFNAKVYHRTSGELLNDWPQNHKMTWFLEYPTHPADYEASPLY